MDQNEKRLKIEPGEHRHLGLGWRKQGHAKGQGGWVRGMRTPSRDWTIEILMILSSKMMPGDGACSCTPGFPVNQHQVE